MWKSLRYQYCQSYTASQFFKTKLTYNTVLILSVYNNDLTYVYYYGTITITKLFNIHHRSTNIDDI